VPEGGGGGEERVTALRIGVEVEKGVYEANKGQNIKSTRPRLVLLSSYDYTKTHLQGLVKKI